MDTHNEEAARRIGPWKVIALVGTVLGAMALQACNTTEGAGKDIKAAGNAIEDAAQDAND
ncbi:MAG: entericidin A/B family lipoprotein [Phycisphaerales bacterium]|nr:entericidin A/B family lipoprotein [Phycisphaerales bacterium]